jgi:hypothetical protein
MKFVTRYVHEIIHKHVLWRTHRTKVSVTRSSGKIHTGPWQIYIFNQQNQRELYTE